MLGQSTKKKRINCHAIAFQRLFLSFFSLHFFISRLTPIASASILPFVCVQYQWQSVQFSLIQASQPKKPRSKTKRKRKCTGIKNGALALHVHDFFRSLFSVPIDDRHTHTQTYAYAFHMFFFPTINSISWRGALENPIAKICFVCGCNSHRTTPLKNIKFVSISACGCYAHNNDWLPLPQLNRFCRELPVCLGTREFLSTLTFHSAATPTFAAFSAILLFYSVLLSLFMYTQCMEIETNRIFCCVASCDLQVWMWMWASNMYSKKTKKKNNK